MIIQLDSNFRDYVTYPYASDFAITINGKPPENLIEPDNRSTYLTGEYIRYAYQWIGNSAFNNPLSKIPNDTLEIQYIPRSSREMILIPNPIIGRYITNDYFVGISFYNPNNGLSSTVVAYNFSTLLVTLADDVFNLTTPDICFSDVKNSAQKMNELSQTGFFVNPSTHSGNNLLLMGTTRFNTNIQNELVLVKGLNTNLIVTNVSKNWSTTIVSLEGNYRNVIVSNVPSYDSNDFFIVSPTQYNIRLQTKTPAFHNGVRSFSIKNASDNLVPGEVFFYKDLELKVINVSKCLEHIQVEIIFPGNEIPMGQISLENTDNPSKKLDIVVEKLGSGLEYSTKFQANLHYYLIGIIDFFQNNVDYFVIYEKKFEFLYIEATEEIIKHINSILQEHGSIIGYFVRYSTVFPNVVIPVKPYQNSVCTRVRLISLNLPNLPVCGFDYLLSDFPYVLVSFSNSQGSTFEIQSQIFSNVPSSVNSNFVCPISNVKNPELNFVSLHTKQEAIFKFKPQDYLRFQILLPNGEILKYNRSGVDVELLENNERFYTNRSQYCIPLNVPLNQILSTSTKMVYPYILNNNISVVFEFQVMG